MTRPSALPVEPCLDPDVAEEELHASLRRTGWTDRDLLWAATLLARSICWVNALRRAGLPCEREIRVMGDARREVSARKTALLSAQDPHDAEVTELVAAVCRDRRPARNGFPDWMTRPPAGWLVEPP